MTFQTIQTQRLLIRKFEPEDAQDVFELDSDPEVMKFFGVPFPKSIEDSIASINRQISYYEKYTGLGVFPSVLADTNEFIGWCCLKDLDNSNKIEVGYRLKKKFWGKGYATELAIALLKYGFENLKLHEIYAVTHPDNVASQKVLIKAGLRFIGPDRFYNRDLKVFKITNQG